MLKDNGYVIENGKNEKNKDNNNNEYLKKIEMLENENKLLKGEISESKNRLLILENKIGKLLCESNILETEECPQPMPYVKKYTAQTCINFYPHPHVSTMNDNSKKNDNEKEIEEVINKKEIINKTNNNNNKKKALIINLKYYN